MIFGTFLGNALYVGREAFSYTLSSTTEYPLLLPKAPLVAALAIEFRLFFTRDMFLPLVLLDCCGRGLYRPRIET